MDLSPSRIELASKKGRKDSFVLKFLGYLCIPCCCAGCICLGLATEVSAAAQLYVQLIEFYGGIVLARQMAARVRQQANIFRDAVIHVNNSTTSSLSIDPNLTLLDLVRYYNPRFNETCRRSSCLAILDTIQDMQKNRNKAYYSSVWNTFIEMGGNPNTVIYGFIELILETSDPTSTNATNYAKQILTNISLRNEIEQANKAN